MRTITNLIFISLTLILFLACDNENNVSSRDREFFLKYYGQSGNQFGAKVIAVEDGFVMVGTSRLTGDDSQIYVVGTDSRGNELWSNTFGRPDTDDVGKAIAESANGYVLVGNSINDQGTSDILLYRLGSMGENIDSVVIGDQSSNQEVEDVIVTQSGNILLAGSTSNASFGGAFDFYFPQFFPDLSPVPSWAGKYGFSGTDKAIGVRENSSGEFVFLGTTDKAEQVGSEKAQTNMIMFQITSQGIPNIAGITFGSADREVASGIASLSDGGYAFVGSTSDDDDSDIFISRIRRNSDLLGEFRIMTKIDANVTGVSIFEAQGGGFFVLGDVATPTGTNIYMARIDNRGVEIWKRTFGFIGENTAGGVLQLPDGSIIFNGSIRLDNQSKLCLIKTNENGDLEPL